MAGIDTRAALKMLFLFGDSHVRDLHLQGDEDPHEVRRDRLWRVMGTGGASARGLSSPESRTGAAQRILSYLDLFVSSHSKVLILLFGDVDVSDHAATSANPLGHVHESVWRYREFMQQLLARPDVGAVIPCLLYPRTRLFSVYGQTPKQHNSMVRHWNATVGSSSIDLFSPLAGDDGFLRPEFCHSLADPGERHLSHSGREVVWWAIERHLHG